MQVPDALSPGQDVVEVLSLSSYNNSPKSNVSHSFSNQAIENLSPPPTSRGKARFFQDVSPTFLLTLMSDCNHLTG